MALPDRRGHLVVWFRPIVPKPPHADRAFGIFAEAGQYLTDLLNHTEHLLRHPVEAALFLFGLMIVGVTFSTISAPTWLIPADSIVGNPLGVLAFGYLGAPILKVGLPATRTRRTCS